MDLKQKREKRNYKDNFGLNIILVILFFGTILAFAYSSYVINDKIKECKIENNELSLQFKGLNEKLDNQNRRIYILEEFLKLSENQTEESMQVKYLIELAYLNLTSSFNSENSIYLLQLAQTYLKHNPLIQAQNLNDLLSKNISELEKANVTLQKKQLLDSMERLEKKIIDFIKQDSPPKKEIKILENQKEEKPKTIESEKSTNCESSISTQLKSFIVKLPHYLRKKFIDLVIIKKHPQQIKYPLNETQRESLILNVKMLITHMKWAISINQSEIFKENLSRLKVLVAQYLDTDLAKQQEILTEITKFADGVIIKYPDLAETLYKAEELINESKIIYPQTQKENLQ